MPRFYEYEGDLMGLPADDNHLVFRWLEPRCKILFSVSRLGDSASCHFASDKAGLRHLKKAINEFCEFCFKSFGWSKMIIAKTKKQSVERLIKKCYFKEVITEQDVTAYARCESWDL